MAQNNILLLFAIAVILYLILSMNCKQRPTEFFDNMATVTDSMKTIMSPQMAPAPSGKIDLNYAPSITVQYDKPTTVTIPEINDEIFKPVPEDKTQNLGILSNFTLGVDINDPINNKYTSQAPRNQMKLTTNDLLPGKATNKWFDTPEVGVKIEDANLLADAINKVGVDTIGQTRKNPSYDIRGTIPCPKFVVSPWSNSSYEPDINLKSLY